MSSDVSFSAPTHSTTAPCPDCNITAPSSVPVAGWKVWVVCMGSPPWRQPQGKWHLPKEDPPFDCHLMQVAF